MARNVPISQLPLLQHPPTFSWAACAPAPPIGRRVSPLEMRRAQRIRQRELLRSSQCQPDLSTGAYALSAAKSSSSANPQKHSEPTLELTALHERDVMLRVSSTVKPSDDATRPKRAPTSASPTHICAPESGNTASRPSWDDSSGFPLSRRMHPSELRGSKPALRIIRNPRRKVFGSPKPCAAPPCSRHAPSVHHLVSWVNLKYPRRDSEFGSGYRNHVTCV